MQYTKIGKLLQLATKYTNLQYNEANDHKVHQMLIKDTQIIHSEAFRNWGVWYENKPSSNPDSGYVKINVLKSR
jgi:hypothetical protein